MSQVSDNFNRGDGGLGANWTDQQSSPQISSNAANGAGGGYSSAHWSAQDFAADQDAQVTHASGSTYVAPGVRHSGTGSGTNWYAYFNHGVLQKCVAGSVTDVATGKQAWTVGDTAKVAVSGTTLSCFKNGTPDQDGTNTDSALASGSAGIAFFNAGNLIDDWLANGVVDSFGFPYVHLRAGDGESTSQQRIGLAPVKGKFTPGVAR